MNQLVSVALFSGIYSVLAFQSYFIAVPSYRHLGSKQKGIIMKNSFMLVQTLVSYLLVFYLLYLNTSPSILRNLISNLAFSNFLSCGVLDLVISYTVSFESNQFELFKILQVLLFPLKFKAEVQDKVLSNFYLVLIFLVSTSNLLNFSLTSMKLNQIKGTFIFGLVKFSYFFFSFIQFMYFIRCTAAIWLTDLPLNYKLFFSSASAISLDSFLRQVKQYLKTQDPFSTLTTKLTNVFNFADEHYGFYLLFLFFISFISPFYIAANS